MPRIARSLLGNHCYHVFNRGNQRQQLFHDDEDYRTFVRLMQRAHEHARVELYAYCLMPNHFHFVMQSAEVRGMSRWMHWLMTAHVVGYRRKYGDCGRIWQGRYKSFAVQQNRHLLAVLRYVERNPLTAGLVGRAEEWPWSSLATRTADETLLTPPPVPLPENWIDWVNEPQTEEELAKLRKSTDRGTPFGDSGWVEQTVDDLGVQFSVRGRGRPGARVTLLREK